MLKRNNPKDFAKMLVEGDQIQRDQQVLNGSKAEAILWENTLPLCNVQIYKNSFMQIVVS